ncbi:MAG: hypothetical protein EBV30_09465 [Actinobacteria bacterium]|nr:hypothetical protein [Actinomycetota bacterium]
MHSWRRRLSDIFKLTLILWFYQLALSLRYQNYVDVDRALSPYAESFIAEARRHFCPVELRDIIVQVAHLESDGDGFLVIGLCEVTGTFRRVSVDPVYWKFATEDERLGLMYHELGHCLLGRDHTEALLPDGRPASLMHPYLSDGWEKDRERYLNELFDSCAR